jgi:hypothetical protein
MRFVFLITLALLGFYLGANALPLVSDSLGSNMVLQSSPAAARIWGWTSTANEAVRIKFNGQTYTVTSTLDEFGNNLWSLDLPPTPVNSPFFLLIICNNI